MQFQFPFHKNGNTRAGLRLFLTQRKNKSDCPTYQESRSEDGDRAVLEQTNYVSTQNWKYS